jgi:hypothetical protein
MDLIDIHEIKRHYRQGGGYWFEPDTMRFFRCRLAQYAYCGPGGIYFTTSEKGPDERRAYSVRSYNAFERDVDTVGEFQQYASRSGADRAARRCAEGR